MFYTLSKALLFLLQPTIWMMALLLIALVTRSKRKRKRLLFGSLLLFIVFGNSLLFDRCLRMIEYDELPSARATFEYAVVLGGYGEYNTRSENIEFFRSADRLTEAIALYQEGRVQRIVLSSGVHEDGHPEWNEAEISKDYLVRAGVPSSDIILEDRSWNTHENAFYTSQIIDKGASTVLITSAFHMNRALACFEKQGLRVTPYPVDFMTDDDPVNISYVLIPSLRTAMEWQVIIKEQVGILVYRLKGYI